MATIDALDTLLIVLGCVLSPLILYFLAVICLWLPWALVHLATRNEVTKGLEKLSGPTELPFIGSILTFLVRSNFLVMPPEGMAFYEALDATKTFSRISVGIIRRQLMVLVNDADTAHFILSNPSIFLKGPGYDVFREVTPGHLPGLDGEGATRIRHILTKAFSKAHQTRFAIICATRLTTFFQSVQREGEAVEVSRRLREIALDSVAEALLGAPLADKSIRDALGCVMLEWHARVIEIVPLRIIFPASVLPRQRRLQQSMNLLKRYITELVEARSNLALGPDEEENMLDVIIREGKKMEPPLTSSETFNAIFTTLSMGHENVSTGMSWAVALLAQNANLQERIREEFSGCDSPESVAEKVMKHRADLVVTSAVIKETLRLYPSIPILSREARDDQALKGVVFPGAASNTPVEFIISPWTLHRSKHIWGEDAAEFKPSRWTGEAAVSALNKKAYFPFGIGSRACLGVMFANIEMSIVIGLSAVVLKKYALAAAKPEPNLQISLRPRFGVVIRCEK